MAFNDYRSEELLSERSQEKVLRATRVHDSLQVALSITTFEDNTQEQIPKYLDSANKLAEIHHDHLNKILEVGTFESSVFCVTTWCVCGNLLERIEKGITIDEAVAITIDIASALGELHANGFVHGDVSPTNVLFKNDGTVLLNHLSSFQVGIAHEFVLDRGTPIYLSPERIGRQEFDGRADFYSLGVLLFLMLVGELPKVSEHGFVVWNASQEKLLLGKNKSYSTFTPVLKSLLATNTDERCLSVNNLNRMLRNVQVSTDGPRKIHVVDTILSQEIDSVLPPLRETNFGLPLGAGQAIQWYRTTKGRVISFIFLITLSFFGLFFSTIDAQDQTRLESWIAFIGFGQHPQLVQAKLSAEALRADPNQSLEAIIAAYRESLSLSH